MLTLIWSTEAPSESAREVKRPSMVKAPDDGGHLSTGASPLLNNYGRRGGLRETEQTGVTIGRAQRLHKSFLQHFPTLALVFSFDETMHIYMWVVTGHWAVFGAYRRTMRTICTTGTGREG